MKTRIISFLFLLAVSFSASSQTTNICSSAKITGWSSASASSVADNYTSLSEAKQIIRDIISAIGLKQNFQVMAANVPNAAAVIYRGERYILYNPDFISRLNAAAGNKWAVVSVLAHEVGHHLNGHTLENVGSQPDKELEADEFSGFVLRRMGATLDQAQVAMKIAANYKSSLTHPGQQQRLVAIAAGWNNADRQLKGQDVAKYDQPVTPANVQQRTDTRTNDDEVVAVNDAAQNVLADKYILRDVHFNSVPNSDYFITTRYHLVRVANNQVFLVGNVVPSQNRDYPFVITDANDTRLYVDTNGSIVNNSGRRVGYLTAHR